MIESSKINRENYLRKCFWIQENETRVKFNPGLRANRPSNNSAQDGSPLNMLKLTKGALDWKTGQNTSEHGDDYVEENKLRVKKLNSGGLGYTHTIPDNSCAGTKPSLIGLLFSHNKGDFGAISVTERSKHIG